MFNLRLCNAAIIRYSQVKFGHMYLCGMDYKYFSPHCCKCNSFGCTAAIRWGNACHGPHSDSLYSGSEHSQFNSPRLVKRASPTHGGRWLAQTNYDALMTHHTTDSFVGPRTLQWRHNEHNGVPNHRRFYCLLNRLFRRRSKKTSKLRVTGLCEGNPSVIGGFPS